MKPRWACNWCPPTKLWTHCMMSNSRSIWINFWPNFWPNWQLFGDIDLDLGDRCYIAGSVGPKADKGISIDGSHVEREVSTIPKVLCVMFLYIVRQGWRGWFPPCSDLGCYSGSPTSMSTISTFINFRTKDVCPSRFDARFDRFILSPLVNKSWSDMGRQSIVVFITKQVNYECQALEVVTGQGWECGLD